MPEYMRDFSCIGPACEDTCCSGWRIDIDQEAYEAYTHTDNPNVKPLLQYVQRNEASTFDGNYAEIRLKPDYSCPFLSEDRLCIVHLNLGEKYLSNLCATFPRLTNIVDEAYEKSATVACPEIARLALLNPKGITFTTIREPIDSRHTITGIVKPGAEKPSRRGRRYFPELREFTIQILQNRTYSLPDRLIILGLFYSKLQDYIASGDIEEIPGCIASYAKLIESGAIMESLPRFTSSITTQMQLLRRLIDVRLFKGVKSDRYLQCLMATLSGLEYTNESLRDESVDLYMKAYHDYYRPFMAEHEYILENYLVNYTFKNLIPRIRRQDAFADYALLIVNYALIKFHLIGMAGNYKEAFGTDHVIMLIQSFSKIVEHTGIQFSEVAANLQEPGLSKMELMAVLIRN
jgi:lysine-N-methylase